MDSTTNNNSETAPPNISNQTVLPKQKQKRKFSWTPARKAAFEKCIAARKKQLGSKVEKSQPKVDNSSPQPLPPPPPPKPTPETSKESSDSDSDSDALSSSSSEATPPPKRKVTKKKTITKRKLHKQFQRMKEELSADMKKHLRKVKRERQRPPLPEPQPVYHPPPQYHQSYEEDQQDDEDDYPQSSNYYFV